MKYFTKELVAVLHEAAIYGSPIELLVLVQYDTANHNFAVSIVAMIFSLILVYVNI